jgi:hypothetical protein
MKTWYEIQMTIRQLGAPYGVLQFPNTKSGVMIELATGKEVASTPDKAHWILIEGKYK